MGGVKKQEKMKRINIGRWKAGCPSKRKGMGSNVENEAPISVMFVDNTLGGLRTKGLQAEELRLGMTTGYSVRIAKSTGMPL